MQNSKFSEHDLILKGGRIIDPFMKIDGQYDVAFKNMKVSFLGPRSENLKSKEEINISGKIVCPGLIDLHTHVYWGGTMLGVNPEIVARKSGVSTLIDAGSAGAGNYEGFKKFIVDKTGIRILGFINISFAGICGFGKNKANIYPECEDKRLLDSRECVDAISEFKNNIIGIKVRIGNLSSGKSGILPLKVAREVADEVNLPIMTHVDFPPPKIDEVLNFLRPGDIWTHCFRPSPNAPLDNNGNIRESVLRARERGIVFDLGHGAGSLSFEVSRSMLEKNFFPDTLSSDVHKLSINGPAYDLLVTMSKFLNLGLPLSKVIEASTSRPAQVIGRSDIGNLREGSKADALIFEIKDGNFKYTDVKGETFIGKKKIEIDKIIVGGKIW